MKITDPDVIKTGEKELIDSVKQDLDWEAVKEIIMRKISADAFKTSDGEIVVHDNQVAFRMTLELNLPVSLMFDRNGNYIEEKDDAAPEVQKTSAEAEDLNFSLEDIQVGDDGISGDVDTPDPAPQTVEENYSEAQGPEGSQAFDQAEDLDELEVSDVKAFESEEPDELQELGEPEQSDAPEQSEDSDEALDEFDLSDFEDDDIDDDIDDILKESKEFWEQKK